MFRFLLALFLLLPISAHAEALLPWRKADKVVVVKSERTLTLYAKGDVLKIYNVSLGGAPKGSKLREGDNRTPEGSYVIDGRNPYSRFHKSLHISYPNEEDRALAERTGAPPGGQIFVHGLSENMAWAGKHHRFYDWTKGCIAVTNEEIDELWQAVDDGTPIEILP